MDRGVKITFLNMRINAILAEMKVARQQLYTTYRKYKDAEDKSCEFATSCEPPINWAEVKRLDDIRDQAFIEYSAACKYMTSLKHNLQMHNYAFEKQLSKMVWLWK
jgi:hypothetical protein